MQAELYDIETELSGAVDEIWPSGFGESGGEELQSSWATRMEDRIKERERAVKAILKPELHKTEKWWTKLMDAGSAAKPATDT